MNEMLRGLGFGQVTNTKWTNGRTMKHHVENFMRMVGKCIQVDEE